MKQKTRQNAKNKQTFCLTGRNEIDEKTRQNAENKQTFGLTGKLKKNPHGELELEDQEVHIAPKS